MEMNQTYRVCAVQRIGSDQRRIRLDAEGPDAWMRGKGRLRLEKLQVLRKQTKNRFNSRRRGKERERAATKLLSREIAFDGLLHQTGIPFDKPMLLYFVLFPSISLAVVYWHF